MTNFWNTAEVEAWSRDFDYPGYLDLHMKMGGNGGILSFTGYKAFCALMEQELKFGMDGKVDDTQPDDPSTWV